MQMYIEKPTAGAHPDKGGAQLPRLFYDLAVEAGPLLAKSL